jgi:filamin
MFIIFLRLENCTKAMKAALDEFDIPLVVTPNNMCSPELDELSSITYLSYYMKKGSPGYLATLNWIQSQLPDEQINNFSVNKCLIFYDLLTNNSV